MRKAVIHELAELAEHDERLVLLTGDLGFMVIEEFADRHPRRLINVGVAESNMIGVATGLALEGMRPYCYSIGTFAVHRPFEHLRNGAHGHNLAVRILGVGGGFGYGHAGPSHHVIDDIAVLRALPRLRIVAPADDRDAAGAIRELHAAPGPTYFRLTKDSKCLDALSGVFHAGALEIIGRGPATILALGSIADEALRARELLAEHGIDARVAVVTSVAPFPDEAVAALLRSSPVAVTVEDHVLPGGFGALVAETTVDHGVSCRLHRIGIAGDEPVPLGSERYMRHCAGLDGDAVAATVATLLSSGPARTVPLHAA